MVQDKFPELCNTNVLTMKFFRKLQNKIEIFNALEEAHAHGESPIMDEIIGELKHTSLEQTIGGVAIWKLILFSLFDFVADNNRYLLEAVADLSSGQHEP